jgi:hypothetical protein
MNDYQNNKLTMYLGVQEFLNENVNVWNSIPAYVKNKEAFDTKILELQKTIAAQTNTITGVASSKKEKRTILVQIALAISSALQSYADDTNNIILFKEMAFTESQLNKMQSAKLPVKTQAIHDTAKKHITKLADYNVTDKTLEKLQELTSDFLAVVSAPKVAIGNRGVYTQNLKLLFKEADDVLHNKLAKLTVQFKITNPTFYYEFLNAMEIYDSGKGSKTITVTLKPEEHKTIYRVINGSKFVNTGKTTLIYCGDHLPPCDMGDENTVTVKPGETVKVEFKSNNQKVKKEKIHFITVTNLDKTQNGSCTIKVTSEFPLKE